VTSPLVSILICTHNRAELIRQTLASVLAQPYAPVELIVVDDGSTDATPDVLAEFADRLKYHRITENRGIAHARNVACRLARGDLIAFQDDDDLMPSQRIVALTNALRRIPEAVFAVGDMAVIDQHNKLTGGRWLPERRDQPRTPRLIEDAHRAVLWPTLPVAPHTTLFRRSDGECIGWFDAAFSHAAEDKDFFARLARLGPVAYVPEVVSLVRRGHASLTRNSARTEYFALKLYDKHLRELARDGQRGSALYRRLQWRMGVSLERIELHRARGVELPDFIPNDYAAQWLPRIRWIDRTRYRWRVGIREPLRRLARDAVNRLRLRQPIAGTHAPTKSDRSPLRP